MISFPNDKLHNAYIIETNDYEKVKKLIMELAVRHGFDKEPVYSYNHPDIVYFESEDSKFSIVDLRAEVIDSANFSPKVNDKKFYIIHDAVYLDNNMQNALLKTLEEPPAFCTFFLVTSNSNSLLDTVKSRAIVLKDNATDNYKEILDFDFTDEAILHLSNIKYDKESDIMSFADGFAKHEERFKDLIKVYRYIIRDVLLYKKTMSKEKIHIKEKETEIISIANTLSYEELGALVDSLDNLSMLKGYQIDKKIAVFNFLSGGKNGKVLRN